MKSKIFIPITLFILSISIAFLPNDDVDWPEYLGGADRNHYSKLTQINPENVSKLQIAWTYSTPDSGQMQVNPLIVEGVLYGVTPAVQAFALDAATGKEIWRFGDPLKNWASTSRGVSYWQDGNDKRILYTAGPNLWALDAKTGKPIESFGDDGKTIFKCSKYRYLGTMTEVDDAIKARIAIAVEQNNPLVFEIIDDGTVFDINQFSEPTIDNIIHEKRKGGLGIRLVKSIMDKIEYQKQVDKSICCLIKNVHFNKS